MTAEWPVGAYQVVTNMGVKGAAAWSMPIVGSHRPLVAHARRKRRRTTTLTTTNRTRVSQGMAAGQSLTALAKRRPDRFPSEIEMFKAQQTERVDM